MTVTTKFLLKTAATAVAALTFFAGCSTLVDCMMFQPHRSGVEPGPNMKMLEVEKDVKIATAYYPVSDAKFVLLYSHGNAEDLFDLRYRFEEFNRHGYSVLGYDYRGYGASTGKPDEKNCKSDAEKVYRYAVSELKIPPEKIIFYGRSLGGGPSCFLAEKHGDAAGLILESVFSSAYRVVFSFSPWGDRFENMTILPHIKIPVMIIHGKLDKIVDVKHAEDNYKAASQPKKLYIVQNAEHNNLMLRAGNKFWQELNDFCATLKQSDQQQ